MGSSQRVLLLLVFLVLVVFSGCGLFKKGCGDCPKWGKAEQSHFPDRTSSWLRSQFSFYWFSII